ncbi:MULTISPECIES: hypothetical protein [Chryseobacterium]|uniref:Uncharacterized protein n=1 Tax=Chryseobacterium salivictor TaxID=2547600 RepID=A0A4P6ZEI2_9FLAO|nr:MULTISPECIES: hypothetical protein [Chryseobacterium]MDQ0476780.1 hypothetical protein [Chryseobacterium sp. MDT2-18]QBO57832.1 hypothetical protein NBC122_01000 [Chryseobacterium salivictor]
MKPMIVKYPLAMMAAFLLVVSCKKKETESTATENPEVVMPTSDSLLHNDSTDLSYDSATVKTAVGVKDEEQNAVKDEKEDAEKLKKDEQHEK